MERQHRFSVVSWLPSHRTVDAWSNVRLPFEPKGSVRGMRDRIRAEVERLTADDDEVLHAVYATTEPGIFDVENVLLYNVGSACFTASTHVGVRLERIACSRSATVPGLSHLSRYSIAHRDAEFAFWSGAEVLAELEATAAKPWSAMSAADVWLAVHRGDIHTTGTLPDEAAPLALRLNLEAPSSSGSVSIVKPVIDGVLAALHVHDGTDLRAVAQRLGSELRIEEQDVSALLRDGQAAVLGRRRLIWTWRNTVQWNPADDRLVACELLLRPSTRVSLRGQLTVATSLVPVPLPFTGLGGLFPPPGDPPISSRDLKLK